MKIGIDVKEFDDKPDERCLVLTEVFNSIILRTAEGNEFAICMRDDTVEMKVVRRSLYQKEVWYRANMETGEISEL